MQRYRLGNEFGRRFGAGCQSAWLKGERLQSGEKECHGKKDGFSGLLDNVCERTE